MKADCFGFRYPELEHDACIGCGACDSVCPVVMPRLADDCISARWARSFDREHLGRSSSGGVFGVIAQLILDSGGVVVGAAFDEDYQGLHHILVYDTASLSSVQRSKYVQSIIEVDIYSSVRELLKASTPVFFCGTSCQVAGMRAYLGRLADSTLFLSADVVCHGVPSPALWAKWVRHIEESYAGKMCAVNFRDKCSGWKTYSVSYELLLENDSQRKIISNTVGNDWYMRAFLNNASLRSSCFSCPTKRCCGSDLTLGDYWGIESQHPEADSSAGVSAVLVNTDKGQTVLDRISDSVVIGASSYDAVVEANPSFFESVVPYSKRDNFLSDLENDDCIFDLMSRWSFVTTLRDKISKLKKLLALRLTKG